MKFLITENQYRKLQKYLKEEKLREASFGKKLGMAALGAGLSLSSPKAKAQSNEVEPSGKFSTFHITSPVIPLNRTVDAYIDNYTLHVDSLLALNALLEYVFHRIKYRNTHLEVNLPKEGQPFDSVTVNNLKEKFKEMFIDTINVKFRTRKGFSSDKEFYEKTNWLKRLKIDFNPNMQKTIPLKDVVISDKVILKFLEWTRNGKTDFAFQTEEDGRTTMYCKYTLLYRFPGYTFF